MKQTKDTDGFWSVQTQSVLSERRSKVKGVCVGGVYYFTVFMHHMYKIMTRHKNCVSLVTVVKRESPLGVLHTTDTVTGPETIFFN